MLNEPLLTDVSRKFQIYGEISHAEPIKEGHINETYKATYNQGGTEVKYIHQKINQAVFPDPVATMENLQRVTEHIRQKLSGQDPSQITRRCLILVPTREGGSFFLNGDGYWRTFVYIEGSKTFETVQSTQQAHEVGRAFGLFQSQLADLGGARLHETIKEFHNTQKRYQHLMELVEKDHHNRAAEAKDQIEFVIEREAMVGVIVDAMQKGIIPERITHNDTKLNNVMFDTTTLKALCVVDLDTVMPGSVLFDFGDMVRTTTNPALEDELDLSKVDMHMAMFKSLVQGFWSSAGSVLTKAEKDLLAFSGKLITFELGVRFLTDYLNGDKYFKIHRPEHNLQRCCTQFKLVECIERQEEAMQAFVNSLG